MFGPLLEVEISTKVNAVVARSTFRSQNVQNTPTSDHFLEVEMSKKCTPLWREARVQVKMHSAGGKRGWLCRAPSAPSAPSAPFAPSAPSCAVSLCVAGVARIWHVWHWVGCGDALGLGGLCLAPIFARSAVCLAFVEHGVYIDKLYPIKSFIWRDFQYFSIVTLGCGSFARGLHRDTSLIVSYCHKSWLMPIRWGRFSCWFMMIQWWSCYLRTGPHAFQHHVGVLWTVDASAAWAVRYLFATPVMSSCHTGYGITIICVLRWYNWYESYNLTR